MTACSQALRLHNLLCSLLWKALVLNAHAAETLQLYEKRFCEGYDVRCDCCPENYDWMDEQGREHKSVGPFQQPANVSKTPAASTNAFFQLPLVQKRPESSISATEPVAANVVWQIEQQTRSQDSSGAWHQERSSRLTASTFHDVRRKKKVDETFLHR